MQRLMWALSGSPRGPTPAALLCRIDFGDDLASAFSANRFPSEGRTSFAPGGRYSAGDGASADGSPRRSCYGAGGAPAVRLPEFSRVSRNLQMAHLVSARAGGLRSGRHEARGAFA